MKKCLALIVLCLCGFTIELGQTVVTDETGFFQEKLTTTDYTQLDSCYFAFTFDETGDNDTTVYDASPNGLTGTMTDGTPIVSNGKFGKCAWFDGVDNCIEINNMGNKTFDEFTAVAWIKTEVSPGTSVTDARCVLGLNNYQGAGATADPYITFYCVIADDGFDGMPYIIYGDDEDANGYWQLVADEDVATRQWVHLAVTRDDSGDLVCYVNGSVAGQAYYNGTDKWGTNFYFDNTTDYYIGDKYKNGVSDGVPMYGFLDDVAFYDEILTATQIGEIVEYGLRG